MPSLSRAEIFGITVFTILALTWFGKVSFGLISSERNSNRISESLQAEKPKTILVHIAGAVEKTGLFELPADCRVDDALKIAGGTVLNADTSLLNLAENLTDGDKLYVPFQGTPIPKEYENKTIKRERGKTSEKAKPIKFPININTATLEELMTLPDIGDVRAREIIDCRNKQGGFKKREEIMNVKGIGEGIYDKIKDLIYV